MEIEYDLTVEDVKAFVRFHHKYGPKLKPHPGVLVVLGGLVLVMVVLAAIAGWFLVRPDGDWESRFCGAMIAMLGPLFILFGWLQGKTIIINTIRLHDPQQCRWFYARRRLKISPEGFESTSEFGHSLYRWPTVWQIESTENHVFFYVTLHQAHIIPRHAFRSDQEFEDFIDLACRYHQGLIRREATSEAILDALPARPTGITRSPSS